MSKPRVEVWHFENENMGVTVHFDSGRTWARFYDMFADPPFLNYVETHDELKTYEQAAAYAERLRVEIEDGGV